LGASQIDPKTWIILPPDWSQVDWGLYLAVAYWNVSGFDSLSQVAGEMKDPKRYYWGMLGSMILITISSFVPLSIMVSVDQDYQNYYSGYWPEISLLVAGEWLRILFTIGACVSMFATFNGYLFYGAIQISVWSEPEFLDFPILTSLSRFNTPWVSILTHATIIYALSFLDFEDLIQASTAAYCAAVILEYFALIDLRISKPDMPRPYKIGLGTKGLIAFVTPAIIISAMNIVFALAANYLSFAIILGFFVVGPILWFLRNAIRDKFEGKQKGPYDDLLKDDEAAKLLKIVKSPMLPSVIPMPPKSSIGKPSLMRSESDIDSSENDNQQIALSTRSPKVSGDSKIVDLDRAWV
jgi:amino acid transporter